MDPLSAGFIGSAFKFAEVAWKIAEVGSENEVFVRTIQVVRSDLEEVERLFSLESVQQKLASTPGKLPWIKSAILNTKSVLSEIGKWVERARVEQESTGSVRFDTRVRWVFSDHEKLLNRKMELSTCHQQLSNVLSHMAALEAAPFLKASQVYGDHTYIDDILARHKRTSRSQASIGSFDKTRNDLTGHRDSLHDPARPDLYPSQRTGSPHVPGSRPWSNVQPNSADYQTSVLQSPVLTSLSSPPGSPPPTYATAISIDPVIHGPRLNRIGSGKDMEAAYAAIPKIHTSCEVLMYPGNEKRAYWDDLNNNTVPELAGDTIVFSGTNSAGPVNPFELCASPISNAHHMTRSLGRNPDNLVEMMGDLHFPIELASNDPGAPLGYPPCSRMEFNQISMSGLSHYELRRRAVSETTRVTHSRPETRSALSDSLVPVHELPSLPTVQDSLAIPHTANSRNARPLTPESSTDCRNQSSKGHRSPSSISDQSYLNRELRTTAPNRHYSAPALATHSYINKAFPEELGTSSGVGTHPQPSGTLQAPTSARMTRMQSRRQIMDLIGSLET